METWICPTCGNTNYANENTPDVCIRCNWDEFNKWDGVVFNDAVNDPDWKGFGWQCPCCENYNSGELPEYDVCPLCGWEDDGVQLDDPDYRGGANKESLNEAREAWRERKENDAGG